MASASVSPTVPMGGWEKTTVAIFSYLRRFSDSPLKRRCERRRPAAIATGVKRNFPQTSPSERIPGTLVFWYSSTMMCPFLSVLIPTLSKAKSLVNGDRPTAQIRVLTLSMTAPSLVVILRVPSAFFSTVLTWNCRIHYFHYWANTLKHTWVLLWSVMGPLSTASVAASIKVWSNVRKTWSYRINIWVSDPSSAKTPAISRAMYPAPTTTVFLEYMMNYRFTKTMRTNFGRSSSSKKPSESIPYWAPGTSSGMVGLPPTAMRICFPLYFCPSTTTVPSSAKLP